MKIALALGGGAGLGWTHIGVLRALQESGIEIGAIAGTSIGAIAAASYASDRLHHLEELALGTNFRSVLRYLDPHFKRGAVMGARGIEKQLQTHFGGLSFEDLPIPIAAVAACLRTGDTVVLKSGLIIPAVRASMSLPGLFKPVELDGMLLADGGAAMPVPVRAARELAPGLPVLSVNLQDDFLSRAVMAGLHREDGKDPNSLAVIRTYIGLSLRNLGRYSLQIDPPDYALSPPVGHVDMQNFTRGEELIAIGRAETLAIIPKMLADHVGDA